MLLCMLEASLGMNVIIALMCCCPPPPPSISPGEVTLPSLFLLLVTSPQADYSDHPRSCMARRAHARVQVMIVYVGR